MSNFYNLYLLKLSVSISVVLEVGDGVFEVLSTSGDTHLGGDDFDKVCLRTSVNMINCCLMSQLVMVIICTLMQQRIVDWLADTFRKDEGIDLLKDKQALQRLTETAEKAKIELSSLSQTNIRYILHCDYA